MEKEWRAMACVAFHRRNKVASNKCRENVAEPRRRKRRLTINDPK